MARTEEQPEVLQLGEFLREFNKETDRGAALSAASLLDDRLLEIIRAFLADVTQTEELIGGFNAPLGTFSSRISAAYAFGLLQENEHKELHLIRRIRNEFGHSWKGVTFETQPVSQLCAQLPWGGPGEIEPTSTSRDRFNFAVVTLLIDLLWRARLVRKERRVIKQWPNKSRG